jgi:hypothetical protein
MKVLKYILILAGAATLAQGCIRDDFATCPTAGDGTVLLQIRMPETARTRATQTSIPAKINEYDINHLDVLVFADNGGAGDTFLYHTTPTSEVEDPNSPLSRTFVLPIRKSEGSVKQRLVLIANLETEVAALIEEYLSDENATSVNKVDVMSQLTFEHKDWHGGGLPMWGESTGAIITPTSTGSAFGNINMLFSVARIEAAVNGNSDLSKAGTLDNFRFKQFQIKNRLKYGYAVPQDGSGYANGAVSSPSVPSPNELTTLTESPYTVGSGVSYYSAIGYAQEVNNSELDNDEGLYVLIGGQYVEPGAEIEETTPITWYRVDLYDRTAADPQTAKLDILRGHRYMINITGVDGPGYATAEEAAESYTSKLSATVLVWDGGNVIVDPAGRYKLNVSKSEWTFNGLERTVDDTNNKITISTDYTGGWELASITDENGNDIEWLTLSATSGAADEISEVSINLSAYDSQTPRKGRITIEAGKWSYVVNVSQKLSSLEISPAEVVLDFDYYPIPLGRNELTIDTEGGWMLDKIEYPEGVAEADYWLTVIEPEIANPLQIFDFEATNLAPDAQRTTEKAHLRAMANPLSEIRTATVHFKTEDGATAHVDVRQGWINCGCGGVPKTRTIGGNTYQTHIYGTNISRIGKSMEKLGYFDALVKYYEEEKGYSEQDASQYRDMAIAYIYQLEDANRLSCYMIENSREGNYVTAEQVNPLLRINSSLREVPESGGPYYFDDFTIPAIPTIPDGMHSTAASACPTGWRLPNDIDLWNMEASSSALNNYQMSYLAPDYSLWNTPEVFCDEMNYMYYQTYTKGTGYTDGIKYSNNNWSSDYGFWHADVKPYFSVSGDYSYEYGDLLRVSANSASPAGVYVGRNNRYYSYTYSGSSYGYTNNDFNYLLPVRCVEDFEDPYYYPLYNEELEMDNGVSD